MYSSDIDNKINIGIIDALLIGNNNKGVAMKRLVLLILVTAMVSSLLPIGNAYANTAPTTTTRTKDIMPPPPPPPPDH